MHFVDLLSSNHGYILISYRLRPAVVQHAPVVHPCRLQPYLAGESAILLGALALLHLGCARLAGLRSHGSVHRDVAEGGRLHAADVRRAHQHSLDLRKTVQELGSAEG